MPLLKSIRINGSPKIINHPFYFATGGTLFFDITYEPNQLVTIEVEFAGLLLDEIVSFRMPENDYEDGYVYHYIRYYQGHYNGFGNGFGLFKKSLSPTYMPTCT